MKTPPIKRRTFIQRAAHIGISMTLVDLLVTVQPATANEATCGTNPGYGQDPDHSCMQNNPDENCGIHATPDPDQSCNAANTDDACSRSQSGSDEDQSCSFRGQEDQACGGTDQDNWCGGQNVGQNNIESDGACNGGAGASYDTDQSCGSANEQDQGCGSSAAYDPDDNCGTNNDQDNSPPPPEDP